MVQNTITYIFITSVLQTRPKKKSALNNKKFEILNAVKQVLDYWFSENKKES
jgi:hypothetical protein